MGGTARAGESECGTVESPRAGASHCALCLIECWLDALEERWPGGECEGGRRGVPTGRRLAGRAAAIGAGRRRDGMWRVKQQARLIRGTVNALSPSNNVLRPAIHAGWKQH